MDKLIEALLERQRKSGENDQVFGRRLGMSRALWNAVRHGRRRMTVKHLGRMLWVYPDLENEALEYLKTIGKEVQR